MLLLGPGPTEFVISFIPLTGGENGLWPNFRYYQNGPQEKLV